MANPIKCEWCGQLLFGSYYRGRDKDGEHGYFCCPKCVTQATKKGFRGTPFKPILTVAGVLGGIVVAVVLMLNGNRADREREKQAADDRTIEITHYDYHASPKRGDAKVYIAPKIGQTDSQPVKVMRGTAYKEPVTIQVVSSNPELLRLDTSTEVEFKAEQPTIDIPVRYTLTRTPKYEERDIAITISVKNHPEFKSLKFSTSP